MQVMPGGMPALAGLALVGGAEEAGALASQCSRIWRIDCAFSDG